jgi:hypothetical protein
VSENRIGGKKEMSKILLLSLALVTLFIGSVFAAQNYEAITVADTAIGLSFSPTGGTSFSRVVCTLETAQIRFMVHGGTPTTTTGHLLEVGQQLTLADYASIVKFKAIRTGAVSGALKCSYY